MTTQLILEGKISGVQETKSKQGLVGFRYKFVVEKGDDIDFIEVTRGEGDINEYAKGDFVKIPVQCYAPAAYSVRFSTLPHTKDVTAKK